MGRIPSLLPAGGWPYAPTSQEAIPAPCGLGRSSYVCSGTLPASPGDAVGLGATPQSPSPCPDRRSSLSIYWFSTVAILPGTPLSPRTLLPGHRPEYPSISLRGFPLLGAHLGPSGSYLLRTPASPQV